MLLAIADSDFDIKISNIWESKYLTVLKGHTKQITCLDLIESSEHNAFEVQIKTKEEIKCGSIKFYLISGSLDQTLRIWDPLNSYCVKLIKNTGFVTALESFFDEDSFRHMVLLGVED